MVVRRAARAVRGLAKRGCERKTAAVEAMTRAAAPMMEAMEGRVLLSATSIDIGEGVVGLNDGSIVVGGTSQNISPLGPSQITLVKYNAAGVLQTVMKLNETGFISEMAVDGAGKIVAAGTVGTEFAVMRFNTDLTLDTSFSQDGIAKAFGASSSARDLVIQPDGKIVAVGSSSVAPLALARFDNNGDFDPNFGTDGLATAGIGAGAEAVALDALGRIVVATTVFGPWGDFTIGLARFTPTGSLDTTFGPSDDGQASAEFIPGSTENDLVADVLVADGKIIVAGTAYYLNSQGLDSVALARFNDDGILDNTFGSGLMDGNTVIVPAFSGISVHLLDTAPLDDGLPLRAEAKSLAVVGNRLVVAATVTQTNGAIANETEVGLFGLTLDGYRDSTFGEDGDLHPGVYLYDRGDLGVNDSRDDVRSMAITPTQILVGGTSVYNAPNDFLLVRFGLNGVPGGGNQPPTGDAGGPYTVDEGGSVLLTAFGVDPEDGTNVTYHWDLDDDGVFETAGQSVQFAPGVSGPATLVRNVQIADSANQTFVAAAQIMVNNVAPAAQLAGPVIGVRQWEVALTGSFTDPGGDECDSSWEVRDSGGLLVASGLGNDVLFTPVSIGVHTVTFTVDDLEGGVGEAQHQVQVEAVLLVGGELRVGGTSGGDVIEVRADSVGNAEVFFEIVSAGVFAPTVEIVVRAGEGNDEVALDGTLETPTTVSGGGGDDSLLGSAGSDVLVGGDGNDLLVGGKGDDLLIGGAGADRMVGNQHEDILVGGTTAHDEDEEKLAEIIDVWRHRTDYASGVAALGTNDRLIADVTVFDDDASDLMTGDGGRDTFFGNFEGPGVLDVITDLNNSEFAEDLDLIAPLES